MKTSAHYSINIESEAPVSVRQFVSWHVDDQREAVVAGQMVGRLAIGLDKA